MTAYIAGYARTPFVKFTGQFAAQRWTLLLLRGRREARGAGVHAAIR